ncbi:MAG: LacI family DNA-binding transcriptional regulator [Bacteroidota bacterium]
MKKRPTLADVARAAGVSLMTVSRAINNRPGVSGDLRQSIVSLAQEMGYHPNTIARGLATRHTTAVGLMVPDNTNPFFAQIARGAEDIAYEKGYSVFLGNTNEEPARERTMLDSLWGKNIDGVISCSSRLSIAELEDQIRRFPLVVLLNRVLRRPASNVIMININDRQGARQAVGHFVEQGRKRIAHIGGPAHSLSARRRLEGYRAALEAAGLPFDRGMTECCAPDTEGGRLAAATLLARKPVPDAIFVFNDLAAIGAIQACEEAGKRVPEDIAIIGVDDIPLARIFRPRLTTLHVDLRHIGCVAMRTLLDAIEGRVPPPAIWIDPELMVRESA